MFKDYGVFLVGGAICFGPHTGNFTSFQGKHEETMRRTVIDYVACSKQILDKIVSFSVCDRVEGYDHAATVLRLQMDFDTQNVLYASPSKKNGGLISCPFFNEIARFSL
jgi:hypothetical protein